MKILLLTGKMENGGAETHVYDLAAALAKGGHRLTLLSSGGRYADALARKGIRCIRICTHRKTPHRLFMLYHAVKRLLKTEKFDAVHSHTRISCAVAAVLCKRLGVPHISTVHSKFKQSKLWEHLAGQTDALIAVSEDIKAYLIERNMKEQNIKVIPNGVNTDCFLPQKVKKPLRICFLSRLDDDCSDAAFKLCKIAPRLAESFPDIQIHIGGGGTQYGAIRAAASRANALIGKETVFAVGKVEDTAEFLGGAALFVGVSRAAFEAMSCGVPTILAGNEGYLGVAYGACLPLAESTNFCCRGERKADEGKMLSDITDMLSESPEKLAEIGENSRKYVVSKHSDKQMSRDTEALYKNVAGRRGGALLCGYYGYGNMGDDALLQGAVMRAVGRWERDRVLALTANGKKDTEIFGIGCVNRYLPMSIKRAVRQGQTVVFGGGTLLQNSTSNRSLVYYLGLLSRAQKEGGDTELWGSGVGNIKGRGYRKKTAEVLSKCKFLGLRDRESAEEVIRLCREFGCKIPPIVLENDLAVPVLPCTEDRVNEILCTLGISPTSPIAVVALRGREGIGYRKMLERHLSSIVAEGLTPVFLPMFPREDTNACEAMCRRRGGRVAEITDICEAVGLIKRATVVLAMRYHACVFASWVGTPFVGYGSEPKIERFCRTHGGKYFIQLEN